MRARRRAGAAVRQTPATQRLSGLKQANFVELRQYEVRRTSLLLSPDHGPEAGSKEAEQAAEGELAHSFRNSGNLSAGVARVLTPPRLWAPAPGRRPRYAAENGPKGAHPRLPRDAM